MAGYDRNMNRYDVLRDIYESDPDNAGFNRLDAQDYLEEVDGAFVGMFNEDGEFVEVSEDLSGYGYPFSIDQDPVEQ